MKGKILNQTLEKAKKNLISDLILAHLTQILTPEFIFVSFTSTI